MTKLKNYLVRICSAFKIGYWAFKNPTILSPSIFKMLSDLFELIMKVAIEDKHMMTHLAYIYPEEGEQQIVSIWAGAGIGADPIKRIAELIVENTLLKNVISNNNIKSYNALFDFLYDQYGIFVEEKEQNEIINIINLLSSLKNK